MTWSHRSFCLTNRVSVGRCARSGGGRFLRVVQRVFFGFFTVTCMASTAATGAAAGREGASGGDSAPWGAPGGSPAVAAAGGGSSQAAKEAGARPVSRVRPGDAAADGGWSYVAAGGRVVSEAGGRGQGPAGVAEAASEALPPPAGTTATSHTARSVRTYSADEVVRLLQSKMEEWKTEVQGEIAATVDAKVQLAMASRLYGEDGSRSTATTDAPFYERTPFQFGGQLDDPGATGLSADAVSKLVMQLAVKVSLSDGVLSMPTLVGWLAAMREFGEAHDSNAPNDAAGVRYWEASARTHMRDIVRAMELPLDSSTDWYECVFDYVGKNGVEAATALAAAPQYAYKGQPNYTAESLGQSLAGWFRDGARLLDGASDKSLAEITTRGRCVTIVLNKLPEVLSTPMKIRLAYSGSAVVSPSAHARRVGRGRGARVRALGPSSRS